jgi:hypothetical protein
VSTGGVPERSIKLRHLVYYLKDDDMTNPMEENHERREKHWRRVVLAVFLLIFLSLAAAWPVLFAQDEVAPDYESVMQQFSEAEKKGEYDKAIDILKQMEDSTFTRHIEVVYNMARMYSFTGPLTRDSGTSSA